VSLRVVYRGRVGGLNGRYDVWSIEAEDPEDLLKRLAEVCAEAIRGSPSLDCRSWEGSLYVRYRYGGRGEDILVFHAYPELRQVAVLTDRRGVLGEDLARMIARQVGLEWPEVAEAEKAGILLEEERRERIERLKSSLTAFDYEVLELRSRGVSLLEIAQRLGCTISKVRWSLEKLSLVPETSEKLGAYRLKPRGERYRKADGKPI
jgi:hypothetical protein